MRVPEGWMEVHLADLSTKISDGLHSTPVYVDTSEYFFINGNNLKDNKVVITENTKCISEEVYLAHKKDLGARTLLMSINGTIGSLAYYSSEKVVLGKSAAYINLKNIVDKNYILFNLASSKSQSYFESELTGTTIRNLSLKSIKATKITLPPLPEQQKIAQILSTWNKAIEKLEALLAAKQKRKKSMMQQLLTGNMRFPGFDGEWKKRTIKQMGKVVPGGTPDTNINEYWDGDILWMTPTDVTALKTRFISNTKRKITQEGMKNSSATMIPSGSLLVCTRATIGVMSISTTDITTNQGFKNLVPSSKFDVNFLYYLFNFFKKEFIRYSSGSTFFELSKKDFEKLIFECPELKEQQKIAAVLSAADEEITIHQKQLAALKQQKTGLMQQLLTGKKRVQVDQVAA